MKTKILLFVVVATIFSSSGDGSALGALISAAANAVATALTNEIVAERQCNFYALSDMPAGKYSLDFLNDKDVMSGPKDFSVTLSY